MISQVSGTASSPGRVVGAIMPYTRSGLLLRVHDGFPHRPNTTTARPHYSIHIPVPQACPLRPRTPRQPHTSARGQKSKRPRGAGRSPPHPPVSYTRRFFKQPPRCMYRLPSRQKPPSPVQFILFDFCYVCFLFVVEYLHPFEIVILTFSQLGYTFAMI